MTTATGPRAAPPSLDNVIVRASAGTGKTFALSSRYLKLVQQGVAADSILATTFTRKAAGEILGRVLVRLARGAIDAAGAAEFTQQQHGTAASVADCRAMLTAVCRQLHRVSICTIDSFFNRMATSFRHELGVPPQARIVGADDPLVVQLRREAIDAMLGDDEPAALVDLLRRLHHDDAQRSVTEAIDQIVRDMYEVYRQTRRTPQVWSRLAEAAANQSGLLDAAALSRRCEVLRDLGTSLPTGKPWLNAWRGNRESADAGDWMGFLSRGLAKAIAVNDATFNRRPVPPAIVQAYQLLIEHARAALVDGVVQRTEAIFELIQRFDAHDTRLRFAHRVLLFSDLPLKLAHDLPAMGDDVLMDIYYRLDTRVGHLLLDEFQDTSVEQWRVLRPFAQEIAAHGDGSRSFFCVGDVKQAIYGWRGGCAEIFDQVETDLHLSAVARKINNTSWRSAQVVIDAVNRVFTALGANPALQSQHALAQQWQQRFEPHATHRRELPGYVELITSPATTDAPHDAAEGIDRDDDDDGSRGADASAHERFVAQRIGQIVAQSPGRSVGVLVVTNDQVRRTIHHLRQAGVAASGEGGTPVTDDAAVGAVLAALALADHPGDTAAAFHVVNSPMGDVVGLDSMDAARRAAAALAIRRALVVEGYAAVITKWARRIAPSCGARSVSRLMQLIELADQYDPAVTLRPSDFVRFVEGTAVQEPSPAPVRVMTVHKAKGLEFDIVVLPQLDRMLFRVGDAAIYVQRRTPVDQISAVYAAAAQSVRALCPPLADAFAQEQARRFNDDLCALYVAMTRARQALHMIAPPLQPKKNGAPKAFGLTSPSYAALLRNALRPADMNETYDGQQTLYADGDANWAGPAPSAAGEAPSATGESPRAASEAPPAPAEGPAAALRIALAPPAGQARRSWRLVAPSSLSSGGRVRGDDLLAITPPQPAVRGSVIHNWLALIEWLDGAAGVPDDAELLAAARREAPSATDAWLRQVLSQFKRILQHAEVAAALTHPPAGTGGNADVDADADVDAESCELWRERPFVVRQGDHLLNGKFDRVIIHRRGGPVVRVELIDFKTDDVGADQANLAALVEQYRPQLEAYRAALASMLALDPGAIRARLLFVGPGVWADVGPA